MRDALVIPAWEVASSNTAIKVFNFLPSLLSTIYLSLILLYQVAWSSISLFGGKDIFFKMVVDFVHASYFFEVAIVAVVFLFLYLLITPIAEGGLVALIDRADRGDALAGSAGFGITRGLKFFLPIFEASNITALFKLLSIITFSLFLVRLFGIENIWYIAIVMGLYFLIAVLINIFLAYTRFFIVIEERRAFDAITASANMALENLGVTIKLYTTLLLVYVRTILTVCIFILFPFIISAILTYAAVAWVKIILLSVLLIMVGIFMVFVSHLNSVLEIFVETLWYRAYKDNKSRSISAEISHDHTGAETHHA